MERSRREFIKLLSLSLALSAGGQLIGLNQANASSADASSIQSWVTDAEMTYRHGAPLQWSAVSGTASNAVMAVDATEKYQEILGFGGAFTDASCYLFDRLKPDVRDSLFKELFGPFSGSPSGLNLNVCRTCIGSSDYSTSAYTFDEGEPDPDLKRFSIERDRAYLLPMLRQARKVNPELFLFSTPWTPPGWMKSNNSMYGGSMRSKYMESYAKYFVKFLRAYEAEGVPIQAVSIQNEVDTDQDGRMPACIWPQEYEEGFARQALGPLLQKEGLKTKIWLIDHNYNLWGRAVCELESPDLRKYVDGIAWHGYLGQPQWMMHVHDAYPGVNMYWTEGGPDVTSKDYATDYVNWSKTFTGILRNWCRSITVWNLALDERGKPNIGPFPCGGLVTITDEGGVVRSGQYWALAHYSSHVQRGAQRIKSTCSIEGLEHIAFKNPDGTIVLVLTNTGLREVEVRLQEAQQASPLKLSAGSITTLVWKH